MVAQPAIGFAFADLFVWKMKDIKFASESPSKCLAVVVGILSLFLLLLIGFSYFRDLVFKDHAVSAADDEEPADVAGGQTDSFTEFDEPEIAESDEPEITEFTNLSETEDASTTQYLVLMDLLDANIFGFVSGFMISFYARFEITGQPPGSRGEAHALTDQDANRMAAWALGNFSLVLLWKLFQPCLTCGAKHKMYTVRMVTTTLVMSCAWSTFYACQWKLWTLVQDSSSGNTEIRKMKTLMASILLVLISSAATFGGMILCRIFGAKRFLLDRSFNNFCYLIMGFAMETATMDVLEGGFSAATKDKYEQAREEIFCIICLTLVFLPGWLWYMVPMAYQNPEEEKKPAETEPQVSEPKEEAEDEGQTSKTELKEAISAGESPQKKPYSEAKLAST